MAGAVTLCGVGLCMIGGALMMQGGAQAHAGVAVMPSGALAVAGAVNAQAGGEPTVVWYGVGSDPSTYQRFSGPPGVSTTLMCDRIYRAWSDGTVEMKRVGYGNFSDIWPDLCGSGHACTSPWIVISSPTDGFRSAADINADEMVDGADLAMMLGSWGDASRVPFPPSDCPLNLMNP